MPQDFNALATLQAFQGGRDMRNQRQAQEQAQQQAMAAQGLSNTRNKIETALSSGDREGAQQLAQGSGDADVMAGFRSTIQQMDEQQRETGLRNIRATRATVRGVRAIPAEQRPQWVMSNAPTIEAMGLNPQEVAQMDLSDANLAALEESLAAHDDELYRSLAQPRVLGENDTLVNGINNNQTIGDAGIEARGLESRGLDIGQQNANTARIRANRPDSPLVMVQTGDGPQLDPFQARLAEEEGETFAEFFTIGQAGQRNFATIERLGSLLDNVETGGPAAFRLAASRLGVNLGEDAGDLQAAEALINQLIPTQRAPGSGPMSDADLDLFRNSLPRIINQPGGNQTIMETLRGIAEYDIHLGNIARSAASGAMTQAEAREAVNALSNPLAGMRQQNGQAPRLRYNANTGRLEPIE